MMRKKEKTKQEKFHRLILAYVHNGMLKFPLIVLELTFFSCTVFIICIKITKTVVRELVQIYSVLVLLVNISQVWYRAGVLD